MSRDSQEQEHGCMTRRDCTCSTEPTKRSLAASGGTTRWLDLVLHDGASGRTHVAFPYDKRRVDENIIDQIRTRVQAETRKALRKTVVTTTNWRYLSLAWKPSDPDWPRAATCALSSRGRCFEGASLCLRGLVRLLSCRRGCLQAGVFEERPSRIALTCRCHHHPRCDEGASCGCCVPLASFSLSDPLMTEAKHEPETRYKSARAPFILETPQDRDQRDALVPEAQGVWYFNADVEPAGGPVDDKLTNTTSNDWLAAEIASWLDKQAVCSRNIDAGDTGHG
ncbi:hypothetical protein ml_169 [Mollivirus sibericum]|uniref:hypothetical protein n=1 Tax=Mollivirus sibericum TaxID=1678078 RepID=UPI0006B2E39E|nr:hypothetical protein ml_169 [Mollivirus sibericum]ALD61971.1 hypothetical protein ml_169 [Mollivirus sibericum]